MASPDYAVDIDATLASWRQGDCVLGGHWFLGRADPARPLTDQSRERCDPETGNYEGEVPGFAVLTQTCDLVRRCDQRPFVEVAHSSSSTRRSGVRLSEAASRDSRSCPHWTSGGWPRTSTG